MARCGSRTPPGARTAGWPAPPRYGHRTASRPPSFPDYRALAADTSDNIPGVRGIGAKTASALLNGVLDELPASGRLVGRKGTAITSAWQQVLTWRDMIRMNDQVPVPAGTITGLATMPLPRPAEVIEKLGLWRRVPSAGQVAWLSTPTAKSNTSPSR